MYIYIQRKYKKVQSTCFPNWKESKCQLLVKWIRNLWYSYTMEYYAALKKKTFVTNSNMVVASVKGKKPDTKNIGCMKFKTGKANLGGSDGKKGVREDLWGADMFCILIWVMLTPVCSLIKIHRAARLGFVHSTTQKLQKFTRKA